MGLLSGLGKFIETNIIVPVGNAISNIIKPGSGTATAQNTFGTSTAGKIYTTALGAATAATVVATVVSTPAIAKAVIPQTLKGKAIAVIATPIVAGVVASSTKAQNALINAPATLSAAGSDVGKLIDNPSLQGALDLAKEHPGLVAGVAAAAIAAVGGGVLGAVTNIENTQAVKKNTAATIVSSTPAIQDTNNLVATPTSATDVIAKPKASKKKKKTTKKKKATKKKKKTKKKAKAKKKKVKKKKKQ